MTRMIILLPTVAIVVASGLGFAAGDMSPELPSIVQPVQTGQAAGTQAAPEKGAQQQFGRWGFSCADVAAGAPKQCAARLALKDKSRNVTVLNWLIGHNKDGELLMEITTPVDVLIAPGLRMAIADGEARSFAYLSCATAGCLTRIRPDAQMLDDLRNAKNVKLTIETTAAKAITFSIEVTGIAESLDALAGR